MFTYENGLYIVLKSNSINSSMELVSEIICLFDFQSLMSVSGNNSLFFKNAEFNLIASYRRVNCTHSTN